ncbi:MAG: DUF5659 domain-containing protein [Candidatus Nitrosotenuis sp.]
MTEKLFNTQDIVLAAALKVKGLKLHHIEKTGNKGTFFFEAVDDEIVQLYDLGQLLVEPVAFNNAIKALTTSVRRQY